MMGWGGVNAWFGFYSPVNILGHIKPGCQWREMSNIDETPLWTSYSEQTRTWDHLFTSPTSWPLDHASHPGWEKLMQVVRRWVTRHKTAIKKLQALVTDRLFGVDQIVRILISLLSSKIAMECKMNIILHVQCMWSLTCIARKFAQIFTVVLVLTQSIGGWPLITVSLHHKIQIKHVTVI